jgi:hypothetical protein
MNTVTIELGGAQLTVAIEELFRAWLEKHITQPALTLPQHAPAADERYVGTIMRADGIGHHIYRLLIQRDQNITWYEAMIYAKEQGAELPDRVEGALMFATREDDEYEDAWHWTRDQHASNDTYAVCQNFGTGLQGGDYKSGRNRVVLVRRVAI